MRSTIFYVFFFALGLSGCVSQAEYAKNQTLTKLHLVELSILYENQLVSDDIPHATIQGFPYYIQHGGYSKFRMSGFYVSKLNNTEVKSLYKLEDKGRLPTFYENGVYYGLNASLIPLKMMPGFYDIEVTGAIGAHDQTLIKNAFIEANKNYVIYTEIKNKKWMLSIREYTKDVSFPINEVNHYVIERMVSDEAVFGH